MSTVTITSPVSLDSFRNRRRARAAAASAARSQELGASTIAGATIGVLERRFGLMASAEGVVVTEVLATSGDLAVADRLAFVEAMEHREPIVVLGVDGWYMVCRTSCQLTIDQVSALRDVEGAPRLMSIASERGITPVLGPLVA